MDLSQQNPSMTFKENQRGQTVMVKLQKQREQGHFCDVIFHVQDEEIPAHRNVLAACSAYFDALLKKSQDQIQHINIDCRSPAVFETMVDYMYMGIIIIDGKNVEELVYLANQYAFPKLKCYCCEYLERNMTVANCFSTKAITVRTGLNLLTKVAEAYIMANIMDIIQNTEILFFTQRKIMEFISNKTLPVREEIKIHVVNRWVRHSPQERQYHFQNLLHAVSWKQINIAVVYTLLREDVLYKTSPWCLYSLLKELNDHNILPDAYQETFDELCTKFTEDNISEILKMNGNPVIHSNEQNGEQNDCMVLNSDIEVKMKLNKQESFNAMESCLLAQSKHEIAVSLEGEDELYASLDKEANGLLPMTEEEMYHTSMDIMNMQKDSNEIDSPHKCEIEENKPTSRHKRKGIPMKIDHSPMKVCIAKVKLKSDNSTTPRKRGRPPKISGDVNKYVEKIGCPPSSKNSVRDSTDMYNDDDNNDGDYGEESSQDIEFKVVLPKKRMTHIKKKRGRKAKNVDKFHCEDCKFVCTSHEHLDRHRQKSHKDAKPYSCAVCNFESTYNREYYNHVKTHFKGPPFHCDYSCGYTAERIQSVLYHRMSHTDERPFECSLCSMTFRSKTNMHMHERSHSGLKPFTCEVCSRSFATKGTLDQHSVTHSDLRPYLCDLCGFSTKYQSHLIAHKRIHTGDVFRCQYPSCKYSTPKRSQLACHMRTHMSIRSHICSQCGRAFVEKSHLIRHEKIHLEDKPFKCQVCDYRSTRRDKLKDHLTKYHGETSPKMPYKPRKSRRQTFDPSAFPMLNSEDASAEMEVLLQQSVEQRDQERVNLTLADITSEISDAQLAVSQSLFTPSASGAIVSDANIFEQVSSSDSGQLTMVNTATAQSILPSLIDPRLPMVISSGQQPIMVMPQNNMQMPGLYSLGQTLQTDTLNSSLGQQSDDSNQNTLQDITIQFMSIF